VALGARIVAVTSETRTLEDVYADVMSGADLNGSAAVVLSGTRQEHAS
jgi:hypothetical protein